MAVYATFNVQNYYGLIDTALYFPGSWTKDVKRCKAAGILKDRRELKSKVELALDLVKHQLKLESRVKEMAIDQPMKTGKGDLVCKGYVQQVYVWDGVSQNSEARQLIIRVTKTSSGIWNINMAE